MSDNPLADWLRERNAALGASDASQTDRPDPGPEDWPEWAPPVHGPPEPEAACWDRPPDSGREPSARRRRRRLILLAALPWLAACGFAAALLMGAATVTGEPPLAVDSAGAKGEQPASGAAPVPAHDAAVVDPALGAAAAVAVRLSVTTPGDEKTDDGQRRYVDLAVPEGLHWYGGVAVVTVAAVLLEGPPEHWRTARPARFAVPTAMVDGRAVALGQPWVLGQSAEQPAGPTWQPAAPDPAAVAEATRAAGYAEEEVIEVTASPGLPGILRARVLARAPGEQGRRTHDVWLRADPDPAVLGVQQDRGAP